MSSQLHKKGPEMKKTQPLETISMTSTKVFRQPKLEKAHSKGQDKKIIKDTLSMCLRELSRRTHLSRTLTSQGRRKRHLKRRWTRQLTTVWKASGRSKTFRLQETIPVVQLRTQPWTVFMFLSRDKQPSEGVGNSLQGFEMETWQALGQPFIQYFLELSQDQEINPG